ncbi:hypothetical protein HYU09_02720 [Candidatus Woesearchaeota archaeon]|nr:hypothetical protein [Candidatus Woesearchaeota archaeon]
MKKQKKIDFLIKSLIIALVFSFIISLGWYFKIDLYFADRYSWYIYLAEKHMQISDNDFDQNLRSLEYINKAISLDKNRAEAHKLKVRVYYNKLKLIDEAEKELSLLKEINESYFYHLYLGEILREKGNLNDSLIHYKKAIEIGIGPLFIDANIGMGLTYLKISDFENAFKYLNYSRFLVEQFNLYGVENEKNLVLIHAGLGFIYQKKGDIKKAKEELEIAESIKPKFEESIYGIKP